MTLEERCWAWLQAIAAAPNDPAPLRGLALALQEEREWEQALPLWQQAAALEPSDPAPLLRQIQCLEALEQPAQGRVLAERALQLEPREAWSMNRIGVLHWQAGRMEAAEAWIRRAQRLEPANPELLANLGAALESLERYGEAIAVLRQAEALHPQRLATLRNLAISQSHGGDPQAALQTLERALALEPQEPELRLLRGLLLLQLGDYARGWPEHEARLQTARRHDLLLQPAGEPWPGPPVPPLPSLMLIGEQGLGDMIQFARYAPLLRRFAERIELCVHPKLRALFEAAELADAIRSPDELQSEPPGAWLPLLSVAGLLGVRADAVLAEAPYLRSDPQQVVAWRQRLGQDGRLLVGLNWQGNPQTEICGHLRGRSLPLRALAPLAELEGLRFVALQQGVGQEQRAGCGFADRFVVCQQEVDAAPDFRDSAAILRCCDLVISSDTALAHLAGALGCPTWLLLHRRPDWRWGRRGTRTPWYPTMTLFRQGAVEPAQPQAAPHGEPWEEVVAQVRQALIRRLHSAEAQPPMP